MNKKLLAMAVSAAMFAPVAAQADVTVYGIAQVEYSVEDTSASGVDDQQSVDDDGVRSRIGVKFSEKLGEGLSAFGKFEWALDPADKPSSGTPSTLGDRDAFVGLKGSWGSLAAGSFHAPYKTAGGVKWDPWTASHLQARRAGGMLGGTGIGGQNGFMRNTIYYTSPDMNGFKAEFALSPDDSNPGAENGVDGDNDYSLAIHYKNGPWHAIFAHNKNNNDVIDDETLTKFGLQWKSGAWTLQGQYEMVEDADAAAGGTTPGVAGNYRPGAGDDADVIWLNGQYKMGNNIITASWGNMDVDNATVGGSDFEYDYWAIGVIHKFSKKTRVFAGYTETNSENDADNPNDRDAFSVGIRKDF